MPLFARQVGRYLEHARQPWRRRWWEELPKDLSWLNQRELERYFAKNT